MDATTKPATVVSMAKDDTAAEMGRLVEFVNTRNVETQTDELDSPAGLRDWLQEQGLLSERLDVSAEDVAVAHALREGLRQALLAHDQHAEDGAAASPPLVAVPLQLHIGADGQASLAPQSDGVAAALARLVAGIPAAQADGAWLRLKACPRDTCQWAFVDQSRNRSRRWCSMEVCGNREKTQSFRDRQRDD